MAISSARASRRAELHALPERSIERFEVMGLAENPPSRQNPSRSSSRTANIPAPDAGRKASERGPCRFWNYIQKISRKIFGSRGMKRWVAFHTTCARMGPLAGSCPPCFGRPISRRAASSRSTAASRIQRYASLFCLAYSVLVRPAECLRSSAGGSVVCVGIESV